MDVLYDGNCVACDERIIVYPIYPSIHIWIDKVLWYFRCGESDKPILTLLCPNGTLYNQQYFVCDWWFNVDCSVVSSAKIIIYHLDTCHTCDTCHMCDICHMSDVTHIPPRHRTCTTSMTPSTKPSLQTQIRREWHSLQNWSKIIQLESEKSRHLLNSKEEFLEKKNFEKIWGR